MTMDAPLKQIKGYEIRERIGAGGFGAVYKAYQTTIGREVAIKVILPDRANQPDFIRRFESEAQLVARLEHPHIVPLYDYWRDPNGAYLVMRWLRGGSLRDALANGAFDLRAIPPLLDQIAGALALAHRSGIIHRDIKPGNILLDEDGNAYLTDFGIAKDLSLPNGTASDMLIGSLDYISPEQARGERVTPRTDLYSLGVTLYETIMGQHPFEGVSSVERLYKHINDPLPLITSLDSGICEAINGVIQKATAKNPDHRHPDVLALAAEFRTAIGAVAAPFAVEEQLTQREHEILRLIIDGLANKEIAQRLTLTLSTVKWHVNQIYSKLGVRSRVQAIIRARELDLLGKGRIDGATVLIPTADFNPVNPYKGLLAFQSADSQDFYGREKITGALVRRLGESGAYSRFLTVVGPSGSGKSSLVKAGMIPALWRGELPGSERWFVAEMVPGAHPLDELEVALIRIAANQGGNLHEHLRRDARGLVRCAGLILPNDGTELVLVIDQFEEVYTLAADEDERAHFLALLCVAVTEVRSRVRVVITLRADFYDRPLHDPQFGDLVRSRLETIMPLSAEELERAIVRPAERAGVTFEPGLVTTIIGDVNYQPGGLPLLQFALTELFERRQGRLLTRAAYDEIGGTTGALAKRAEEVYLSFAEREREITRQIFMRLVTLGESVEDTRRRATRSEFKAIAGESDVLDDILDSLAAYRLIALDTDPATRTPTVELAHEALLREWERLRAWLNEARDDIKTQRQLAGMADEWRAADHDASFLARGSRLAAFDAWRSETTLRLSQVEREFLDASLTQRQRDTEAEDARQAREQTLERRSRTFLRGLVGVLLLAVIVSSALTLFALDRQGQAQTARDEAVNAQATSEANFALAEQQRLALSADAAMDDGAYGNIGMALALRSLDYGYSTVADAALARASHQGFVRNRLTGHQFDIYGIKYSPDGRLLALAGENVTIIYDGLTGQSLRELPNVGIASYLVFIPDTPLLVIGSGDGAVVWDAVTGEQIQILINGKEPFGTWFYSDGSTLFTSDTDEVILWDTTTWEAIERLPRVTDDTEILLIFNDGSSNSAFVKWDMVTNRVFITDQASGEETCELLPSASDAWVRTVITERADTPLIFVATVNQEERRFVIHPFEYLSCKALPVFDQHQAWINGIDYDPMHDVVISNDNQGTTYQWRLSDQQVLSTIQLNSRSLDLDVSPDGSQLAVQQFNIGLVFDLMAPAEPREVVVSPDQYNATHFPYFSPDGESLYIGGFGRYSRWKLDAGTLAPMIRYDQSIRTISVSPDGRTIAASTENAFVEPRDTNVYLIDALTGDVLKAFAGHNGGVNVMDFSPDGTLLATPSFDQTARIWNVATAQTLHVLEGHEGVVAETEFSQDGRLLLTTSSDGTVRLWDVASGEQLRTFDQGAPIPGAALSPDNQRLVIGDTDGSVVMWDVSTGERLQTLGSHGQPVWSVNYSPDGSLILSTGFDGTARLWDGTTGALVRLLDNGKEYALYWAEFSPDGRYIVTGGEEDDRVYVWQVSLENTIADLCRLELPELTPEERTQYGITDSDPICPPS
jgi:serine/threonine protein kinase/WD40 repeat protein